MAVGDTDLSLPNPPRRIYPLAGGVACVWCVCGVFKTRAALQVLLSLWQACQGVFVSPSSPTWPAGHSGLLIKNYSDTPVLLGDTSNQEGRLNVLK